MTLQPHLRAITHTVIYILYPKQNKERIPIAWTGSSFTETRSPAGPFGIKKTKTNEYLSFGIITT